MTGLYSRWAIMMGLTLVIALMTYNRYQQHLSTVPFKDLMNGPSVTQEVRIQGMVKSGTLNGDTTQGQATFELVENTITLPVEYQGPPLENIRELKTMVFIGTWDKAANLFRAKDTALMDNFGFVAAAYAIVIIPMVWVLFAMSQRVMVLFKEIKDEKLYEPEVNTLADKQ